MKDRKPCPFCGGNTIFVRDMMDCTEIRGIYCMNCKVLAKWNIEIKKSDTYGETADKLVEKWNRRATEEAEK